MPVVLCSLSWGLKKEGTDAFAIWGRGEGRGGQCNDVCPVSPCALGDESRDGDGDEHDAQTSQDGDPQLPPEEEEGEGDLS